MNVPRGLFRLWLVASLLWSIFSVEHNSYAAAIEVPLIVLGVGALLVWAIRGFGPQ
jgi:hypothetical protein